MKRGANRPWRKKRNEVGLCVRAGKDDLAFAAGGGDAAVLVSGVPQRSDEYVSFRRWASRSSAPPSMSIALSAF